MKKTLILIAVLLVGLAGGYFAGIKCGACKAGHPEGSALQPTSAAPAATSAALMGAPGLAAGVHSAGGIPVGRSAETEAKLAAIEARRAARRGEPAPAYKAPRAAPVSATPAGAMAATAQDKSAAGSAAAGSMTAAGTMMAAGGVPTSGTTVPAAGSTTSMEQPSAEPAVEPSAEEAPVKEEAPAHEEAPGTEEAPSTER